MKIRLFIFGIASLFCSASSWGAAQFTASATSYIHVGFPSGSVLDVTSGPVTMCTWFKSPASDPKAAAVLMNLVSTFSATPTWSMQINSTSPGNLRCSGRDDASNAPATIDASIDYNDGNWHWVACVYISTAIYLYADGVFKSSTALAGFNVGGTSVRNFALGDSHRTTDTQAYNGMLDDPRLYNRALSLAEIQTLGTCHCSALITDGLVSWPDLNAGTPGAQMALPFTIPDRSGYGNNLTATNVSALVSGNPGWRGSTGVNRP